MPAYRLTRAAADDLVDIYIQGVILFGQAQADRYHDGLEAAFGFLADYPRSARLRTEIARPVRAYPYKSHLIVYDVAEDDQILILRVRHGHEDWMASPD
jgi:toxin ParE1/3/4